MKNVLLSYSVDRVDSAIQPLESDREGMMDDIKMLMMSYYVTNVQKFSLTPNLTRNVKLQQYYLGNFRLQSRAQDILSKIRSLGLSRRVCCPVVVVTVFYEKVY